MNRSVTAIVTRRAPGGAGPGVGTEPQDGDVRAIKDSRDGPPSTSPGCGRAGPAGPPAAQARAGRPDPQPSSRRWPRWRRSGPMRLGEPGRRRGIAPSTLTAGDGAGDSGYVRRFADPTRRRRARWPSPARPRHARAGCAPRHHGADREPVLLTRAQRAALAEALPVLEQLAEPPGSRQRPAASRG